MALIRLPPEQFEAGFKMIRDETLEMYGDHHVVTDYMDVYWENQWMVRENPEEVSVYDVDDATNNGLESYHAQFPTYVGKGSEINVFLAGCVDFMKDVLLDSLREEEHQPRKSPEQKERTARVTAATKKFKENKNVEQFLDECSYFEEQDADGYVPKTFEPIFITKGRYQAKQFEVEMVCLQEGVKTTYRKISGEQVYNAPIILLEDNQSNAHISEITKKFSASNNVREILCRKRKWASTCQLDSDDKLVVLEDHSSQERWDDIDMDLVGIDGKVLCIEL
ncbi:hypothetical protein QAD02_002917 [Eretmocerus hayati]|uniref:Uncharacterized protein n=1 Tax=Eretmocerus hayati TaxID=131215 RepID=A0ACC2NLG9_9HYME|nr:hypothetical protein QAD02_002917 [Eretmocerus hayati]